MSGLAITLAVEADRGDLAAFSCGTGEAHRADVNRFVNRQALDQLLDGTRDDHGYRLLVAREAGELVAVAAHEGNWRGVGPDGAPLAGTEIVVLALATPHQGRRLPDGRSVFGAVLDAVLDDIASCNRGPWLTMVVGNANGKMLAICRSVPEVIELPMSGDAVLFATRV